MEATKANGEKHGSSPLGVRGKTAPKPPKKKERRLLLRELLSQLPQAQLKGGLADRILRLRPVGTPWAGLPCGFPYHTPILVRSGRGIHPYMKHPLWREGCFLVSFPVESFKLLRGTYKPPPKKLDQ